MAKQQEKLIAVQTFEGGINSDIAPELQPPNSLRYAINIRILSTAGGNKGIVTNPKGNVEIEYDLPAGENETAGRYTSVETNRFFWINYNSNGYHGIYYFDYLLGTVTNVFLNLTDSADVDCMGLVQGSLILHIDLVGDKFYWANKDIKPSMINIKKALDKSPTGYGNPILPEFLSAYKLAPTYAPSLQYFTDTTRVANYLYQHLFKACSWFVYDNREVSNTSEFSTVPLPQNESFLGNPATSNNNNCLKIAVETGSKIVKQIKIGIKVGSLDFVEIVTLDKEKLGITDNSFYTYSFYNDNTSFIGLAQTWVYRAFSYLWRKCGLQAFVENAMIYGDAEEGFEDVDVNLSSEVIYDTLFLDPGTVNALNSPEYTVVAQPQVFTREGHGRRTNTRVTLRIGHDVKNGNIFNLFGTNGESDNFTVPQGANYGDDAVTIANKIKQQLVVSGRILTDSKGLASADIWSNTINGSGDVTFSFIWRGRFDEAGTTFTSQVNQISNATLKDTGQSVLTHKSGGSVKYAPYYLDEDLRRSACYVDDAWFVKTDFVTVTDGFKKVTHRLSVKHQPPIWAKYYGIGRTVDLTYNGSWIQFLVQKVITSFTTTNAEYQDLVIGSIGTYQRMYPNTIVNYQFEKNDRIRFMREEPNGIYIPFIETVVLDYLDIVEEVKNEDVTTDGTAQVTVAFADSDNIGRYISISGVERLITGVVGQNIYTLDNTVNLLAEPIQATYKIIDRRGTIRIRKPIGYSLPDDSLIEVYKPTQNVATKEKEFFLFGQFYPIIDWGTEDRAHTGNKQNQNPANPSGVPAIIDITQGTSYVRQRELPTNNSIPGTQVIIDLIEAAYFSDHYESDLNDNGKINPEDNALGVNRFGDRLWPSHNYIQDTGVNGLNDFDNNAKRDYPDTYGKFERILFWRKLLYAFKTYRDAIIPINASVIRDVDGQELLKASPELLNPINYVGYEGGIGDKPESLAYDQNWLWHLFPNAGIVGRLGGDGVLPISEQFFLDNDTRQYIAAAQKYKVPVFGEIDRANSEYLLVFKRYTLDLYNGVFGPDWVLFTPDLVNAEYQITTQALHGVVTIITYLGLPLFVYTPTTGYTGSDYFYFRYRENGGAWSSPIKSDCIEVVEPPTHAQQSVWYNGVQSDTFTTTCAVGTGSTVTYTVPALKYKSYISQDDADQQALDEITAEGQAYADANGFCVRPLLLRYSTLTATVCAATPHLLYVAVGYLDIAPGVIVYTDVNLTTPLTGYSFIVSVAGARYNLSSTTGTVGSATGATCSITGTPVSLRFGNDPDTVCAQSPVTVYINPAYTDIATGVIVYEDSGLTNPLDGYTYIVSLGGEIFFIDNITGEVGEETGGTCALNFEFSEIIDNTSGAAAVQSVTFASTTGGGTYTFLQPQLGDSPIDDIPADTYSINVSVSAALGSVKIIGTGITSPSPLCQTGSSTADFYFWTAVTIPSGAFMYIQLDLTDCA